MNRTICWDRGRIQYATAVDVGGLEVDDARGDAVFAAIHQPIPVLRHRDVSDGSTSSATEMDVLREFSADLSSNEPRLVFIRGGKGTGKSHLVRWLKARIAAPPSWHIVYIEKRNTSLRRVTERILDGIPGERADRLRKQLAEASTAITSDEEAVSALLTRLHHLVRFDSDASIRGLPDLSAAELQDLRATSDRLLGDYTFREVLSEQGGPLLRIVKLALGGSDPGQSIDEEDLHLTETDLRVDPSLFEDLGPRLQVLVGRVRSNGRLREELAMLWDHYLPRAKAEVFTGQGTDLLEVFEDVRQVIASRGQELCIFIEDLVLLHGIDKQLAQALTVPASRDLCKLRAAIAVTDGYLSSMDTFTDRGTHFTLNLDLTTIGREGLRDLVGRYLNAGRVDDEVLVKQHEARQRTPNACRDCPVRPQCHATFGTSGLGHGLYPFNASALDRLIALASPDGFRPREILRQVVRAPLETAEVELTVPGTFPSELFARVLDELRSEVPAAVRQSVRRLNPGTYQAEISLRNFFAETPPQTDEALRGIADYLGVGLTSDSELDLGEEEEVVIVEPRRRAQLDEVAAWRSGTDLSSATALKIRKWICETTVSILAGGAFGVEVWKGKRSAEGWYIGSHQLRTFDVEIPRSRGGTSARVSDVPFSFEYDDDSAVILNGILATVDGKKFSPYNRGRWFIDLLPRLDRFAADLAAAGQEDRDQVIVAASGALMALRNESPTPGSTVLEALPEMLRPSARQPGGGNPDLVGFLASVRSARAEALSALRHRAVAAKGGGAPVLFDVAACYGTLRADLNRRVLADGAAERSGLISLKEVAMNQDRAARVVGGHVMDLVKRLGEVLSLQEDLGTTITLVGELADEAHGLGALATSDTRYLIVEAARTLDATSFDLYRRYARRETSIGPDGIWDLIDDPRPRLESLLTFTSLTRRMFDDIETYLATQAGDSDAVDVASVAQELRSLADAIEAALEGAS